MRCKPLGLVLLVACGSEPASQPAAPAFEPMVYTSTSAVGPHDVRISDATTGTITPGIAVSVAMARLEIGGRDIDAVVAALRPHFDWRVARPGHTFDFVKDPEGRLVWLRYKAGPMQIFHAYRDSEGKMQGIAEAVFVKTSTVFVQGEVELSLSLAVDKINESPALTINFVDLFSWDIDFFTETQKGDRFKAIVEKRFVDGRFVGYGRILGAEYKMAEGRTHRAFWYKSDKKRKDKKGNLVELSGYYTSDGSSVKKAFLKSPIKFATITSRFGMRRHPVLKYKRAHRGVDYGAPRHTGIWAIGDGVVKYAGRRGGYGRVVFIRHSNGFETRYAHLQNYGRGIKTGRRVGQKQIIGYVGSSGLATGPHLHFEVLKNGRHVNPLRVTVPPSPPIPKDELPAFKTYVTPVFEALEANRTFSRM